MTKFFKNVAFASALAVAPFAANAATVLVDGATNDINSAPRFDYQLSSNAGDAGDNLMFTFTNSTSNDSAVAVTLATVNQFLGQYTDGVQFSWSTGDSASFAPGESGSRVLNTTIAAGGESVLTVDFGDFTGRAASGGDIDFFVAAIPLPAGGLLLLSAFGAAAVLRRKKA